MQKSLQFVHVGAAIALLSNTDVPCGALSRAQCPCLPSFEALFHCFSAEWKHMPRYPVYLVFYLLYGVTKTLRRKKIILEIGSITFKSSSVCILVVVCVHPVPMKLDSLG